eukprot:9397305-Lingulodinium_polyedra.AAC.1
MAATAWNGLLPISGKRSVGLALLATRMVSSAYPCGVRLAQRATEGMKWHRHMGTASRGSSMRALTRQAVSPNWLPLSANATSSAPAR